MNKYTEADVNRTHKSSVEELIDICLNNWREVSDPLEARTWYAVAAKLESIKEADYDEWTMARILAQAKMNAQEQAQ
mgnify:FL=1